MTLFEEDGYRFPFADDRVIPRIRLPELPVGQRVVVYRLPSAANAARELVAKTTVGDDGWVDLRPPLAVRAGETLLALPVLPPAIRPETSADQAAIRMVHDEAFGQVAEGTLVDELRANGYVRLSLVAERRDQVVGHILFSELSIVSADARIEALALAPMAVVPQYQNLGIGSALVRRGLEACKMAGHRIVIVLGHVDYYPRFGFASSLATSLKSPYSGPSFMAAELSPGALKGVAGDVVYPPPFAAF